MAPFGISEETRDNFIPDETVQVKAKLDRAQPPVGSDEFKEQETLDSLGNQADQKKLRMISENAS